MRGQWSQGITFLILRPFFFFPDERKKQTLREMEGRFLSFPVAGLIDSGPSSSSSSSVQRQFSSSVEWHGSSSVQFSVIHQSLKCGLLFSWSPERARDPLCLSVDRGFMEYYYLGSLALRWKVQDRCGHLPISTVPSICIAEATVHEENGVME